MSEDLYTAATFEEFWERYVRAHAHPRTRALHAVGTLSAGALIAAGILRRRPALVLAAPLVDYAIAQLSHRTIEGNATQPYRNPRWHVRAELRMCARTLAGTMDAEVARCVDRAAARPHGLRHLGYPPARRRRMTSPIEAMATWVGALVRGGILMGHEEEMGAILAQVVLGPDGLVELREWFAAQPPEVVRRERRGAIHACIFLAQADRDIAAEEVALIERVIAHSDLQPEDERALMAAIEVPLAPQLIASELTQPGLRDLTLALSWQLAASDHVLDADEASAHLTLARVFGVSEKRLETIRQAVLEGQP